MDFKVEKVAMFVLCKVSVA